MITKKFLLSCLALFFLLMSCSKEKTVSENDRQTAEKASQEYLLAEKIFANVFKIVDTQAKQQGDLNGFQASEEELETRGGCPETNLTFTDNTLFPATLDIDFGDGCGEGDDPEASGKITAVFNGLLFRPETSISLSFTDFVYEGHAVSGTYEIANQGKDPDGQWTFSSTIDGQVVTPAGKTISYQAETISKQTEGNDTNFFTHGLAGIFDDVWSTTRVGQLTTSDGLQVDITTPEVIKSPLICKWPVSGIFSLDINDPDVTGTIDFGNGECDDNALLTIGDFSLEIDL